MTQRRSFTITPDNDNDLTTYASKLYVGGAGNIRLMLGKDVTATTLIAVPVGTILEGLIIKRILATGTTATNLIGFSN